MKPVSLRICMVCTLLMSAVSAAQFIPLGDLPGADFSSAANDVSNDGTVVVGSSSSNVSVENEAEAFRWTPDTGMVGLGGFPGGAIRSSARAVSSDGRIVVGYVLRVGALEAFRWTAETGMTGLGDLSDAGTDSFANGISADGNVVVGKGSNADRFNEGFRWTSTAGMVGIGDFAGGEFFSSAEGVSADGKVVVGFGVNSSDNAEASRWTAETGMTGLGDLPDGDFRSRATAASADGSVIVGWGSSALGREAFRWTNADGMVGLGDLSGGTFSSDAIAVSSDGQKVVGESRTDLGNEFFIWTQTNGMQRLQDILVANGTSGLEGWSLLRAGGISDNGQWVVGAGTNPSGLREAFLVRLPDNLSLEFQINAGLSDAWYYPETDGQGFFITVFPDLGAVSLAWFTYDTELPLMDATANLGDPGHRWLTAVGPIDGNEVTMDIELTAGGLFDTSTEIERTDPPGSDGTLILTFDSCSSGTIEYDIPSINRQGIVPIQRVANDNIALCEVLSTQ